MDLQWQRQAELWLRLMDAGHLAAQEQLKLERGRDVLYLETMNGRALLSMARPLEESLRQPALLHLLSLLQPEACHGVPLRAWLARGYLWLAAAAPQDSGADLWAGISRRQRRLLDLAVEENHENPR